MPMKSNEDAIVAAQAAKDNLETMKARFAALRVRMELIARNKDRDALNGEKEHVRKSLRPQVNRRVANAEQTADDIEAFRATRQRRERTQNPSHNRN